MRALAAALALLALAAARPALGEGLLEPPRPRQGYFAALGLATAIDHNWQDGESLGTSRGSLLSLRLGELVTRRFGLGLRIDLGGAKSGPQTAGLYGLGLEAQWELARNLAVRGGVGLGVVSLLDDRDPERKRHGTVGAGYTLGVGYDWFPGARRSGGFALTPVVEVRLVPGSSATALVGLVGFELGWWTGLPRNQLQLPDSDAYRR
jgi:hypothetical protein